MIKLQRTNAVKGEENQFQALADAIIICAVRDYRNASRMLHALQSKQRKLSKSEEAEMTCLLYRINRYRFLRDDAARFLQSDLFANLCDLDGQALLGILKKEVYQ